MFYERVNGEMSVVTCWEDGQCRVRLLFPEGFLDLTHEDAINLHEVAGQAAEAVDNEQADADGRGTPVAQSYRSRHGGRW